MPKSSVGIKTFFDSLFTATVFHYNSCLNHLLCLRDTKLSIAGILRARLCFRHKMESFWQVTEYRSSVFAWHKVIKRENP